MTGLQDHSIAAAGSVLLTGQAVQLYRAWDSFLRERLTPYSVAEHRTPAFIDPAVLDTARYREHFPGNALYAANGAAALCLTPAACFHAYPTFESGVEHAVLVSGPCARYEHGEWRPPFRLASFHMTELVAMGSRAHVARLRDRISADVDTWFTETGLTGHFENATDAFFLSADRAARLVQQLKGLKQEYRVPVDVSGVAVASINDHEDYFGRAFGVRDAEGETAHSFCAAFGLERLTAAGLELWGHSSQDWPQALRHDRFS